VDLEASFRKQEHRLEVYDSVVILILRSCVLQVPVSVVREEFQIPRRLIVRLSRREMAIECGKSLHPEDLTAR